MWPVVVASVVVHSALMVVYAAQYRFDVSALVGASHSLAGRAPWEHVTTSIGPGGYDGLFYYSIARNPWTSHAHDTDVPMRRHSRVLYPILCWLASARGDPVLLLWVMPAMNLAVIGVLTWLGASTAMHNGLNPWWGLLLPIGVNAVLPALRDLGDNLSTVLAAALLIGILRRASTFTLALLSIAAVFAREQNVVIVAIGMIVAAWQRRYPVAFTMALAITVWLGWVVVLHSMYGAWLIAESRYLRNVPFAALTAAWTHLGGERDSTRLAIVNAISLGHMLLLMAAGAYVVVRDRGGLVGSVLLFTLVFAISAMDVVWADLFEYRRVLVWLPLGIWLAGVQWRQQWLLWLLAPAGLISIAATLRYA